MTTTVAPVDLTTAASCEVHDTFARRATAARKAVEWASWNDNPTAAEVVLGVPFESTYWNGSRGQAIWLAYAIHEVADGWEVRSYRWYDRP